MKWVKNYRNYLLFKWLQRVFSLSFSFSSFELVWKLDFEKFILPSALYFRTMQLCVFDRFRLESVSTSSLNFPCFSVGSHRISLWLCQPLIRAHRCRPGKVHKHFRFGDSWQSLSNLFKLLQLVHRSVSVCFIRNLIYIRVNSVTYRTL